MSDQAWCGTWSASGIFGDSKGNIYVAEVSPGNRAQRFVYTGTSSATPPNALTAQQLAVPAK